MEASLVRIAASLELLRATDLTRTRPTLCRGGVAIGGGAGEPDKTTGHIGKPPNGSA